MPRICQTTFESPISGTTYIAVDASSDGKRFRVMVPPMPGVDEIGQYWWADSLEGARENYRTARAYIRHHFPSMVQTAA